MAFKRVVELSIGTAGIGLLVSDLDMEFTVTRSLTFSENTAEFTIYNPKEETIKKLLTEGNNVIFKAGYEDEESKNIFIGNVTRAWREKKGADTIVNIQASCLRSDRDALEYITVSLSYAPNTPMSTILSDVATAGGLVVSGLGNLAFTLINGWVFAGSFRGALQYIKNILESNGFGIYTDNAEIVVYLLGGQDSRFGSTLLNWNNGLLSLEDVTDSEDERKRISFTSLLIPTMQPNGLVTLSTPELSGSFVIQSVIHSGNNYGGNDFTSKVEAAV